MESHPQYFTAMFARFPFEKPEDRCQHPWFLQLRADISELQVLDDAGWIVGQVGADPELLLHDPVLRADFCSIDVSQLRSRVLSVQVAPPGDQTYMCHADVARGVVEQEFGEFVCALQQEDGSVCGRTFQTQKALFAHQLHAQGGEHGADIHASSLVVTNQCPFCSSSFSSVASAKNHFRRAVQSGRCLADRAFLGGEVTPVHGIVCKLCEQNFADHSCYHWHLRSHFPNFEGYIELLGPPGLDFPSQFVVPDEPRPCHRRASSEGPGSGARRQGRRRRQEASRSTGKVVVVQRSAASSLAKHPSGGAPSPDGQCLHPTCHASNEDVRREGQRHEFQRERGCTGSTPHSRVECPSNGHHAMFGGEDQRQERWELRGNAGQVEAVCGDV